MGTGYVLKNFFECWILSRVTMTTCNKEVEHDASSSRSSEGERDRSSEVRDGNVWMRGEWRGPRGVREEGEKGMTTRWKMSEVYHLYRFVIEKENERLRLNLDASPRGIFNDHEEITNQ